MTLREHAAPHHARQTARVLCRVVKALCLLTLAGVLVPSAEARARKRRVRPPAPVVLSAEVLARIEQEAQRAAWVLGRLEGYPLLESRYVITAMAYRDSFPRRQVNQSAAAEPARRIIAAAMELLTPERRSAYLQRVGELYAEQVLLQGDTPLVPPVPWSEPRGRRSRHPTHPDAIDLFAPEGTPVRAAARGVVLLAEAGWVADDPFSTSSPRGGNTIILFDPVTNRFSRYCHLGEVSIAAGAVVAAGEVIGTVGHSGVNASRPGHGGHLHFEVNQYDGTGMRAYDSQQLAAWIRAAAVGSTAPAEGERAAGDTSPQRVASQRRRGRLPQTARRSPVRAAS